jgi:hypothetical protein
MIHFAFLEIHLIRQKGHNLEFTNTNKIKKENVSPDGDIVIFKLKCTASAFGILLFKD